MAEKDFKEYLFSVQRQYLDAKADLADFDEALKAGYITEERLQQVKDEFIQLDINYQRLLYVDFLLNMPSRRQKKYLQRKRAREALKLARQQKADKESVIEENEKLKENIHTELEKIKEEGKQK